MSVVALPRQATPRLWLRLVGPMQAADAGGNNLLPRTRKARAVLAIMAMAAPRPVSRERITSLLWSRRDRGQARGSLRQCVHEIQSLLQPLGRGVIEADREQLRLVSEAVGLDLRDPATPRGGVLLEDLSGLDPAFDAWLEVERTRVAGASTGGDLPRGVRLGLRPLRVLGSQADPTWADGIAEEITAALSRFRWIACLAMPEGMIDAEATYMLDGTVRRAGDNVRVAVRVQDLQSGGEVVWTQTFTGAISDLLGLQDRIATQTAAQVDPALLLREGARAWARLAGAPSSHDLTQAAIPGIFRLDRDGFERAGVLLAEAVRSAPDEPSSHAWYAYWHILAVGQGWIADPDTAMARAGQLAERAVTLDPSDARALTIAGHARAFLDKQVEEALVLHERALALNPALPLAWMMSGLAHCYRGDHAEAIRRIEHGRELSPFDPHAFFFNTAEQVPQFAVGEYERVAELGRLVGQLKPTFSANWKILLAALGHLGRMTEAAEACARLLALEPTLSVRQAMLRSPFQRPADRARYAEGLRKGGLPD